MTQPGSPPDPAQWTWVDLFDRTFLGPDYAVTSNANAGATVTAGELVIGPMSLQSNPGTLRTSVTLSADRWQAPDLQLQLDHRWAPTAGNPAQSPILELTVVGETKNLRWDGEHLSWGTVTLGTASGVPSVSGTSYRTRLTADRTQGRLQVSRNGDGLLDVPLPADWDAGIGTGGTVQIGQASRNGGSDFTPVRTFIDSLAVRRGDGTADLSSGVSGGGLWLGGKLWMNPAAPDDGVGSDGDVWLSTDGSGNVYQRENGVYLIRTQLLGTPGPQGERGLEGPAGPQGPAGRDGVDGQPGELVGAVAVPLLLGDATPDGGLLIPLNPGAGSLIGYELLGVDGPAVQVEHTSDGNTWAPVTFPFPLTAGALRLTRTDDSGVVAVLRARSRAVQGGGGGSAGSFTEQFDGQGFVTLVEAQITTDGDGFVTVTNATATADSEGFVTLERTT
ncbi:hypothetical protein GCM10017784_32490 [Deinococcus indicus]|uniref:collagen-like protein n=1 Tax=Deinococcus indicus TaxID=223556 RepID=UPI0017493B80|nr:collagen-like protein [Deinococcus indicus]GHG35907.1 hypothetical protein GCM10017784_32490 [Deinococcus indicus]